MARHSFKKKSHMPRMPKMGGGGASRPMPGQNEFDAGDEQAMREAAPQGVSGGAPGGAPQQPPMQGPTQGTDPNFSGL